VQDAVPAQDVQVEPLLLDVLVSKAPTIHCRRLDPEESSVQVDVDAQLVQELPLFEEVLV
jgi:hypothetical protein